VQNEPPVTVATVIDSLNASSEALTQQGKFDDFEHYNAIASTLAGYLNDKPRQAWCLVEQGIAAERQSNYPLACARFDAALTGFRNAGDQEGSLAALTNTAVVLIDEADYNGAIQNYQAALPLCQALGGTHHYENQLTCRPCCVVCM
jgi:tetratricopeptide (TPR) repeat protein